MKDVQINFALDDDNMVHRREAYRVCARGLEVRFIQDNMLCPLVNISSLGLGFRGNDVSFTINDIFVVQLECKGKIILTNIQVCIVRMPVDGIIGCRFIDLTQKQAVTIDKLILVLQKRLINLGKTPC